MVAYFCLWATNGPEKILFLDELKEIHAYCNGSWMVWGDFNLIYRAEDKNNNRLNSYVARIWIRVSVSEGYGYADTTIF